MNVLIIGDVMLDHYLWGNCNRISPEAPVPVVNIKDEEWRLGGAANVAINLVELGANSTLIGVCGKDDHADQFDTLLKNNSFINNRLFKTDSRPTTVKSRVLVGGHQMLRIDREKTFALNIEEENAVLKHFYNEVEQTDIILISDYNKGVLTKKVLGQIFKTSRELNKPTIVDPKSADFSRYKGASFIKPNRKEAELATSIQIIDFNSLEQASKTINDITESDAVITTLSEDGVGLYVNGHLQIIPTKAQKVYDVTGAGDTYLAAFAYKYWATSDIFAACEFANLAAAVVVAKIGSAAASLEEINQMKIELSAYES
jgi:D-beta-D-heptose 7-phosphate kinase/D-beta-D-heptose 1-phosphate adenosyltransferase